MVARMCCDKHFPGSPNIFVACMQSSAWSNYAGRSAGGFEGLGMVRLMDKILHDPKDPQLWELWYFPYYGSCRILSINRRLKPTCRLEGK